ncbi:MAG: hypothetical protein ACT4P3_09070, partial [Betaproteobacteria bacterium]
LQEGRSYARPDRTGIIILYASRPDGSPPAEAFAAMWRAQVQPAVPGPLPQPQLHRDGEFTAAVGARQLGAQSETVSVSLVTFTGRGRALGVVGIARTEPALRELLAFFETLKVAQAAASPSAATPIESAWIRGSYKLDVTGRPGSASFVWEHLFFFKGGLASRRWNAEGFDGFDAARAAAEPDSQRWGYYGTRKEQGGAIAILWSNGGELKLERKGRNLQNLQRGSEAPWLPLPAVDKLLLDGLYRRGDGKPSPQGIAETEIRFTPDGRFEEHGVLGAVMREGPAQGKGRYRIASYTLHLDYDGGRRARMGFYALDKPHGKSEAIYLNTFIFSRAK